MEHYNYEALSAIVDEVVGLKDDQGNQVELTITEVSKNNLDGDEWDAFSVIYRSDASFSIPQGTYTLSHKSFGEQRLFLSPNSETEYETVVSRKRLAEHQPENSENIELEA